MPRLAPKRRKIVRCILRLTWGIHQAEMKKQLARIGYPAVGPLLEALDCYYASGDIALEIAEALAVIGKPAVRALIRSLEQERRAAAAAWALGQIGDRRAVTPLIHALQHRSAWVRYQAARSLQKFGRRRAAEPLILALKDPCPLVVAAAAQALAEIGDERAIEPLRKLLRSRCYHDGVRIPVILALVRIAERNG